MSNLHDSSSKAASIVELLRFIWKKKQWWLLPIVITLLLLGILLTLAQSSPLGPFMYTIF
jgi:drug/metabolite transporter superfamily protein YnfA